MWLWQYQYDHIGPTEETKQMKFPHQPHQYALDKTLDTIVAQE